jgi:anti-sigma factor RsiW
MTCRDVSRFLSEYVSNELVADERESFDAHVAECPNCRTYITQYRDTIRAAQLACEDANVAHLPEDLVQTVLEALAKEPH